MQLVLPPCTPGYRTEQQPVRVCSNPALCFYLQARDVRLRPKLQRTCSEELAVFCKDVTPGMWDAHSHNMIAWPALGVRE
jgi:hypothetical protein